MFGWLKLKHKELPPFNSTKVCKACGSSDLNERVFVRACNFTDMGYNPNHMEAVCAKCGYPNWEKLLEEK